MHNDPHVHPLAERYPLMGEGEYEAFRLDIGARGLLNPIWLYEGRILDGRNRLRACREAGVDPVFAEFEGTEEEAAAFVDSQNLHRRHLTAEFRRQRVAEMRAKGMSVRDIAAEMGIHKTQVERDIKAATAPVHTVDTSSPAAPAPITPPAKPEPEPPPPPPPPKVTGRDGKQYPAERPKPPTPKPTPAPRAEWTEVSQLLSRAASLIDGIAADPKENTPWQVVQSLEETGRALLRRARDLRKRHHL